MSQTLQIGDSGLNKPEKDNEKNERKTHKAKGETFLALGDLVRGSKKFFIKCNGLFLAR